MNKPKNDNKNQLIHIGRQPLTRVSKTLAITGKLLNELENREPRDDFRVSIPDKGFQEYLKDIGVEIENGTVAYLQIKNIKQIHCSLCRMSVNGWERGIEEGIEILSLEGINFFKSLISLDCSEQKISEINVSQNLELQELDCWGNEIIVLDVSNNSKLTSLIFSYNMIENIDLTKNRNLKSLFCQNNNLTNLDVSQNMRLEELHCEENQLTALDITKNLELKTLKCLRNKIKEVDTSGNLKLTTIKK
jgi:hypothetical protein